MGTSFRQHCMNTMSHASVIMQGLLLAAVLLLSSGLINTQAAPIIGSASTVVRDVRGLLNTAWRTVVIDDNVHQNEVIRTGSESAARLIFADRTDFMIGARSEVVLDRFIYDASSQSGRLVLRAMSGLMKFRTGRMASDSYRIDTPVATVGVRGTEFLISVEAGGTTFIHVLGGVVLVADTIGRAIDVPTGRKAVVFPLDDERAKDGPVLLEDSDDEMSLEARQMVTQIVFAESALQTKVNVATKQTATALPVNTILNGPGTVADFPKGSYRNSLIAFPSQFNSGFFLGAPGGDGGSSLPGTPAPAGAPIPAGAPMVMLASAFDSLAGWTVLGPGSAVESADPSNPLNQFLELTSGSPVSMTRPFDPPGEPFVIQFDYMFADLTGTLDIYLDQFLLATLAADPNQVGFETFSMLIDDPQLYLQSELVLKLVFNADLHGARLFLDNAGQGPVQLDVGPAEIPLIPAAAGMVSVIGVFMMTGFLRRKSRGN
jgi:hypothetical protein